MDKIDLDCFKPQTPFGMRFLFSYRPEYDNPANAPALIHQTKTITYDPHPFCSHPSLYQLEEEQWECIHCKDVFIKQ